MKSSAQNHRRISRAPLHTRLLLSLCLAGLFTGSSLHAQSLISVGTLGGPTSTANAINDLGQVVGTADTPGRASSDAYLYSGGTMTDLGLIGGDYTEAYAINNSSQIAGQGYSDETHNPRNAFFYSSTGTMTVLPSTLGGNGSVASGINNSGQIVGSADLPPDGMIAVVHAAIFTSTGTITDIGTLGGPNSSANGINSAGQVVGSSDTSNDAVEDSFLYSGGVMMDIGSLGGNNTQANAINDLGQIVGFSNQAGNAIKDAFLYSGGTMTSLGTLGGTASEALAINNSGQIVGNSLLSGNSTQDAFLYSDGAMKDLNTLFASLLVSGTATQTGFTALTTANGINNSGEIVGTGNYWNGIAIVTQGFLLQTEAVPEPSTWGLLLIGTGLLSFWRFRTSKII